jgi:hypothetical protein
MLRECQSFHFTCDSCGAEIVKSTHNPPAGWVHKPVIDTNHHTHEVDYCASCASPPKTSEAPKTSESRRSYFIEWTDNLVELEKSLFRWISASRPRT